MLPSRIRVVPIFDSHGLGGEETRYHSNTSSVYELLRDSSKLNKIINVVGSPGCGKTTFLYSLVSNLPHRKICSERDILFLSCSPGCTPKSLLRCLVQEFPRPEIDVSASTSVISENAYDPKRLVVMAALQNLLIHFRVILLDDINFPDVGSVFEYMVTCMEKLFDAETSISNPICFICTGNATRSVELLGSNLSWFDYSQIDLTIPNSDPSPAEIQDAKRSDDNVAITSTHNIKNWKAKRLIATLLTDHGDEVKRQLKHELLNGDWVKITSISWREALAFAFSRVITEREALLLRELSCLREPLPHTQQLKDDLCCLEKLGIVTVIKDHDENSHAFVTQSTRELIHQEMKFDKACKGPISLSAMELWGNVLYPELYHLLQAAKDQKWAFVPEKWQYKDIVGEKERYNVRDIIIRNCRYSAMFKEIDILEEMLYHALQGKSFDRAAAVMFLMDRFMYLQGTTKEFMDLLDFIQKTSPSTLVAPQMIIRKARVLKDNGDLQATENILRRLDERDKDFRWNYESSKDLQVQTAVCLQIRGDMRRSLGFWLEGCRMLLKTVELFKAIKPVPDKKGWASSLTLAANALQHISAKDYVELASEFKLKAHHPMLEAIRCLGEAAELCVYSPQFYLKNKRILGEMHYLYSKNCEAITEKKVHQLQATHALRESISCHSSIARLESREQYFDFVCGVLRFSYICLEKHQAEQLKLKGEKLLKIALHLYQHYCMASKEVKHNSSSILLIESALRLLQLPEIPLGDSANLNLLDIPNVQVSPPKPMRALPGSSETSFADEIRIAETIMSTLEIDSHTTERDDVTSVRHQQSSLSFRMSDTATDVSDLEKFREAATVLTLEEEETEASMFVTASETIFQSWSPKVEESEGGEKVTNLNEGSLDHSLSGESSSKLRLEDTIATLETQQSDELVDKVVGRLDVKNMAVHPATVGTYDPAANKWTYMNTVAFLGDFFSAGNCRRAYHFKHLAQEEVLGKYLGKQYKKLKDTVNCRQQYMQDVACQMVSRQYAAYFNKALFLAGLEERGQLHFLPAVIVKLSGDDQDPNLYFNVEPYIDSGFEKFSNNWTTARAHLPGFNLLMAFSHFSYHFTNGNHLVVDIQGFTTEKGKGQIYLTDPQILTRDKKGFGTGNIGLIGMQSFWSEVHKTCNDVCRALKLERPEVV